MVNSLFAGRFAAFCKILIKYFPMWIQGLGLVFNWLSVKLLRFMRLAGRPPLNSCAIVSFFRGNPLGFTPGISGPSLAAVFADGF